MTRLSWANFCRRRMVKFIYPLGIMFEPTGVIMKQYIIKPLKRLFSQPSFLICTLVLAISAGGWNIAAEKLQWHLRKLPIPLRKPLDQLDENKLKPYLVKGKYVIPEEIVGELGTEIYIQWALEDTTVAKSDPARFISLFITYYTGDNIARVTHTPDICYMGSGGRMQNAENKYIRVPDCGLENNQLPIRVLTISMPGTFGREERNVLYFFSVHGRYECQAEKLRLILNDPRDAYSYFCKTEITFPTDKVDQGKALAAAEKLMKTLLPILADEHWPDWDNLDRVNSDK